MEALTGATERQLSELLALRTGASGAELRSLTHDVLRQMMRSGIGAPSEQNHDFVTSPVTPTGLPPAGCGASAASRAVPPSRCARLDGAVSELQTGRRFAVDEWHRMCGLPLAPQPRGAHRDRLAPAASTAHAQQAREQLRA